jgi:uncharacterized protein (DUF111 family)
MDDTNPQRSTLAMERLSAPGALDVFYVAVQMTMTTYRNGQLTNAVPEFDDGAAIARTDGLAVRDVQAIARQAHGARPDAPGQHS